MRVSEIDNQDIKILRNLIVTINKHRNGDIDISKIEIYDDYSQERFNITRKYEFSQKIDELRNLIYDHLDTKDQEDKSNRTGVYYGR